MIRFQEIVDTSLCADIQDDWHEDVVQRLGSRMGDT